MPALQLVGTLAQATVDEVDFAFARRLGPWNTHARGGQKKEVYIRKGFTVRQGLSKGKSIAVNLHHLIAQRAGLDVSRGVSFKNGNTFDLRRENLVSSGNRGKVYVERPAQLQEVALLAIN